MMTAEEPKSFAPLSPSTTDEVSSGQNRVIATVNDEDEELPTSVKNTVVVRDAEQCKSVIERMSSAMRPERRMRILKKLKKVATNLVTKDDARYRTLHLNNAKLQQTVLAFDGGLEFLHCLGFEQHATDRNKLVCRDVNVHVANAFIERLEQKIANFLVQPE